jgi:hypothetical protein
MTIFVKDSGNWETVTNVYVKRAGSWTDLTQFWVRKFDITTDADGVNFYQNVFFTTGNRAYDGVVSASSVSIITSDYFEPVIYPSGINGTVQVPYGCNRCRILLIAQGGSGGASATNFAAGAGGSGAVWRSGGLSGAAFLAGFAVTEFTEVFTWSLGNENDVTTSGDGVAGASITVSWPGNTVTVGGGGAGLADGTNGTGGVVSGSGTEYTSGSGYNGGSASTNAFGFNEGGASPAPWLSLSRGGVLYTEDFISTWVDPIFGGGGAGGYNSFGQKGGAATLSIEFWTV